MRDPQTPNVLPTFMLFTFSISEMPSFWEDKFLSSQRGKLVLAKILLGFPALLLGLHMEARSARILQNTWGCIMHTQVEIGGRFKWTKRDMESSTDNT